MSRFRVRNIQSSLDTSATTGRILATTAATTNFGTGNFTLEAWIKTRAGDTTENIFLSSYHANVGGDQGFIFETTSGKLNIYVGSLSSSFIGPAINDGVWHHVVFVRSGDAGYGYVDGVLLTTISGLAARDATSTVPVRVGDYPPGGAQFKGFIGPVKIWSRALSTAEVSRRYFNDADDGAMRAGLVTEYLLTEGSGSSVADTSGSANNGTITTPVWSSESPFKARNLVRTSKSSLLFDGTDTGYVDLGASAAFSLISGTMGMWIKLGQTQIGSGGANLRFFTVAVDGNHEVGFLQKFANPGDDIWFYSYDGSQKIDQTIVGIPKLQWHHLAMAWDSSGSTVYLDGVAQSTSSGDKRLTLGATPTGLINGFTGTHVRCLTGGVDEPFIYNTKLTSDQIATIYRNNVYPTNGLVARYNCDEGAGTSLTDVSGNGHTGTFSGTAVFSPDSPFGSRLAPRNMSACINFTGGATERITFTRQTFTASLQGYTMLAWVKTLDTTGTPNYPGNAKNNVFGDHTGNVDLGFGVENGLATYHVYGAWQTIQAPWFVADGKWHLIGVSHSRSGGGAIRIYVDGVPAKATSYTYNTVVGIDTIGAGYNGGGYGDVFNGQIAECMMYQNDVLTDAEVFSYYQTGIPPRAPSSRYTMQGEGGATVTDTGSAAANGTLAVATRVSGGPF